MKEMRIKESYRIFKSKIGGLVDSCVEKGELSIPKIKKCCEIIETERNDFEKEFSEHIDFPLYRAVARGHITGLAIELIARYNEQ